MTKGAGFQGPYTREDGFYGYNEVCVCRVISIIHGNQLKGKCSTQICVERKKDSDEPWKEEWDDVAEVPFIFAGNRWISFDNDRSIGIKVGADKNEKCTAFNLFVIEWRRLDSPTTKDWPVP